jgi:hypothetical protein
MKISCGVKPATKRSADRAASTYGNDRLQHIVSMKLKQQEMNKMVQHCQQG